jgi:hypothetical protein
MKTSRKPTGSTDPTSAFAVRSHDGAVCFRLRATPLGLSIERERRHAQARARLVQSVVFTDWASFIRWCEADSVRFDYPVVFHDLRRAANALLESHERALAAARDHV